MDITKKGTQQSAKMSFIVERIPNYFGKRYKDSSHARCENAKRQKR